MVLVVQMVVYNLPDRDCAAKASDGELKLSDGGEALPCPYHLYPNFGN